MRITLGPIGIQAQTLTRLHYAVDGMNIPLKALGNAPECELWQAASPVQQGSFKGIVYAANAHVCLASLQLAEHEQGIAAVAEQAYLHLHELGQHLGLPHMLRVWHYLYALNEGEGDAERYKQFCLGRAQALEYAGVPAEHLHAATLVGSQTPGVRMHFILVKQPPLNLENPRQTSAYHYPREYGPRQPAFARASIMQWPEAAPQLFVSGTASIVGHRSRHAEDLAGQVDESLRNIQTLLQAAAETMGDLQWRDLDFLKIYLRHDADLERTRQQLRSVVGNDLPLIFLQAGLCRAELLVEIETQARPAGVKIP